MRESTVLLARRWDQPTMAKLARVWKTKDSMLGCLWPVYEAGCFMLTHY